MCRLVKWVPWNNFGVNNAHKQYKCALNVYCFELDDFLGPLSENG